MTDFNLMVMQFLQAWPWPMCVTAVAFIAARAFNDHSVRVAAELNDKDVLEAKAIAAKASREIQEARDFWEAAQAETTEELSVIKGALIQRQQ